MSSSWPKGFAEAVHSTLLRRLAPEHSSADLALLSQELVEALERGELDLPLTPQRRAVAEASGWLIGPDAPLLQQGERIGWRRWLEAMDAVLHSLLARTMPELPAPAAVAEPGDNLNPEQQAAVLAPDHAPVLLLSGGPGTGKTSTVLEVLRRALGRHPDLRIGLAAPTGKASRRLGDAVGPHLAPLPCFTLHRWLEAGAEGFRRRRDRPLELDLLVIDEMSMVDLALMTALLDALPATCRLVLVGDPAQLPPVGSGAVWQRLQEPAIRERFGAAAIQLNRTYRNRGALADLAERLRQGGVDAFWRSLEDLPTTANVSHRVSSLRRLPAAVRDHWHQRQQGLTALTADLDRIDDAGLQTAAVPLMQLLERDLLLCPRRRGPWSLEDVHRTLLGPAALDDPMLWPEGTPVICGGNQPDLGLSNGDLGVKIGRGASARLLFRVIDADGSALLRRLHPARITALEPALALTIHRAQGSEADAVMLLWPLQDAGDFESCLLYTAITRARASLNLITAGSA